MLKREREGERCVRKMKDKEEMSEKEKHENTKISTDKDLKKKNLLFLPVLMEAQRASQTKNHKPKFIFI